MLRLFYRCLLRLHPSRFRQRYRGEMLWIFDQQDGVIGRLAVVGDGFVSLSRQWLFRPANWRHAEAAPAARSIDGIPTFHTFGDAMPRSTTLLNGVLLASGVFWFLGLAISHGGTSGVVRLPRVVVLPDNVLPEVAIAQTEGLPLSAESQWQGLQSQPDLLPETPPETSALTHSLRRDFLRSQSPSSRKETRAESLTVVRPTVPQTVATDQLSARLGEWSSETPGSPDWGESLLLDPPQLLSEEGRTGFAKRQADLLFYVLDTNRDQEITPEELGRAVKRFRDFLNRADSDQDEAVTIEELRRAIQADLSSTLKP